MLMQTKSGAEQGTIIRGNAYTTASSCQKAESEHAQSSYVFPVPWGPSLAESLDKSIME